jgi:hypothetical protein
MVLLACRSEKQPSTHKVWSWQTWGLYADGPSLPCLNGLWLSGIPQDRLGWQDTPFAHPLQILIKGPQPWLSSPSQRYCSLPFSSVGATQACLIWGRFASAEMISFSPTMPVLLVDSFDIYGMGVTVSCLGHIPKPVCCGNFGQIHHVGGIHFTYSVTPTRIFQMLV